MPTTHLIRVLTKHDEDTEKLAKWLPEVLPSVVVEATPVVELEAPTYSFTEACQGTINVNFITRR